MAETVSGAGEVERELLELLCEASQRRWEARLKPDLTPEDCKAAFVCAAAFTAAADLAVSRSGGAVSSFTAGEVSIKGREAADSAALSGSLRKTAEHLMAPYIKTEDFCFKGVRG